MIATFRRLIVSLLVICIAMPLPTQAAMVATDKALGSAERQHVNQLLARADVQARLSLYGVNASDVQARIAAMSDDEVAQLAGKMDAMPAGGDILGAIVLIFLVLLLTDILGFTKVFPFTKPIK
ncbi:MAG: PA2779 family protein [Betaproteobacteria bacterium]|nr:PA2779 family protein [Betaproteobacteria bacterium]